MRTDNYRVRIYSKYASEFNQSGNRYDTVAVKKRFRAYKYHLAKWLPQSKEAAIADVACGTGNLLYFFRQQGYTNLEGVDISDEQVRIARQVVPGVVEGDVMDYLSRRQERFDLITAFDLIEHFHKDEVLALLDYVLAALKPGGSLILQTPNAESPWGGTVRYGDLTHEICFTPHLLTRILILCGYSDVSVCESGPIPYGYSAMSTFRFLLWKAVRLVYKMVNMVETGSGGSGVYTRVFLARATKKHFA